MESETERDRPATSSMQAFTLDVGRRVRALREARGLRLSDLATLTGVTPAALSTIETGKRDARATTLFKIAEALRVPITKLFSDDDRPRSEANVSSGSGYDLERYR